jgi:hypothetical protein
MQFTYTVEPDEDYQSDGDPEIVAEENERIFSGEWMAVIVTAHVVGPLKMSSDGIGTVVEYSPTGAFDSLDKIPDAHLRELAEEQQADINQDAYLWALTAKRDEINAAIQQMGGV